VGRNAVAAQPRARWEHLEFVDSRTLRHVEQVLGDGSVVAVTAVWFGDVRLIDNCLL
ncbi:MAG TPA: pantoate--beta-alanine ligase, partial [Acidimicrobiaceae bacterium]|nr:pantoate--beta-alanine ligase [Acidimicrobiaceae bacterium]